MRHLALEHRRGSLETQGRAGNTGVMFAVWAAVVLKVIAAGLPLAAVRQLARPGMESHHSGAGVDRSGNPGHLWPGADGRRPTGPGRCHPRVRHRGSSGTCLARLSLGSVVPHLGASRRRRSAARAIPPPPGSSRQLTSQPLDRRRPVSRSACGELIVSNGVGWLVPAPAEVPPRVRVMAGRLVCCADLPMLRPRV